VPLLKTFLISPALHMNGTKN